jgi:methenyltetrahydromethanopterin cyclohydrolase
MRTADPVRAWSEARVAELVESLLRDAPVLEIEATAGPGGARVVDCGVAVRGSWEAGRRLAVISHGGMAAASLGLREVAGLPLAELVCDSWRPALSTHALQVSFALSEVDPAIRISGPVRGTIDGASESARRRRRARSPRGASRGVAAWGVAVVESNRLPGADAVSAIARRAGLPARDLTLLVVPGLSLAGVAQIAGRLNECVLYTLDQCLGLEPDCVVSILGAAPLAPCGDGAFVTQDDMIHYAGRATMVVDAPATWDLPALAESLVFRSSPGYGRLFAELLAESGGVFEAIPGLADLNKVAEITVIDRRTGRTAAAGTVDEDILAAAFARAEERRDEPR